MPSRRAWVAGASTLDAGDASAAPGREGQVTCITSCQPGGRRRKSPGIPGLFRRRRGPYFLWQLLQRKEPTMVTRRNGAVVPGLP